MYSIDTIGRRLHLEANELKSTRSPLLTVRQVAQWLNVSPSWIRDHATGRRRPALPVIRLGKAIRFDEHQVSGWLEEISATVKAQ